MPAPSTLIQSSTRAIDTLLTLLEKVLDESFWESMMGPRLVNLAKRYFGNDFVILSAVFYISTLLRTKWTDLLQHILDRLRKPQPPVVSVELITHDRAYTAVDDFVRRKIRTIPDLTRVFATFEDSNDEESGDEQEDNNKKSLVQFYPPEETSNEIEYKGYTLRVTWRTIKKPKDDEESVIEGSMFRGRFVTRTLEISMEHDSLDLLKQFIQEWTDIYNDRQTEEITIHKYMGNYSSWEYYKAMDPRPISTVALKAGLKEKIVNDMERFRRRKRWYKTRGVPYRRGYLLYGPPGTGKTSLIQALASNLGMDIGIASLLDMFSDSEFSDMLSEVPNNCLVVLEDFDHYIHKLTESHERTGVSVAGMLNALDGIQGQSGSMIFMTCNDITKLPPALLRPGRMDVKLKLDYADRGQMQDMFWQFFGHDPDTLEPMLDGERKEYVQSLMKKFANALPENHVTTAELENYFITLWMEADAENPEDGLYDRLFNDIPEFLEKVKLDRKQAEEHERQKQEKKQRDRDHRRKRRQNDDGDSSSSSSDEEEAADDKKDEAADQEPSTSNNDTQDNSNKENNDDNKQDTNSSTQNEDSNDSDFSSTSTK
ncbi:P-loop containing nucleoside triphosphate hydrolase protein [Lichtheimia hyalospora FSU 10163]|nr:P-loop containing nucleoside triphosphate hydrolase protein [Lichtheimia hyalospora FSU 10163]